MWAEWHPEAEGEANRRGRASRMASDEALNFLRLAAALKIILARSLNAELLHRAQHHLLLFLQEYVKASRLNHSLTTATITTTRQIHENHVTPSFHWVTHIFDQIRDFGPVYGFWSFASERLNKVLKDYNTNCHSGGKLEMTFMRSFQRDVRLRRRLRFDGDLQPTDEFGKCSRDLSRLILGSNLDNRGLVASMAQDVDRHSDLGAYAPQSDVNHTYQVKQRSGPFRGAEVR